MMHMMKVSACNYKMVSNYLEKSVYQATLEKPTQYALPTQNVPQFNEEPLKPKITKERQL